MRKPKVSFIIPVYNNEAYIAEAIDSCLTQTEKSVEVIVVNDGSTDSTGEILEWIKEHEPRVKIFGWKENHGRSAARNAGIINASADIMLMLDSDDLCNPMRAELTLKAFKKSPDLDLVYGKYQLIDGLGAKAQVVHEAAEPFNWNNVLYTKFTYIGHSTMAFTRRLTEKVGYTEGEYCSLGIDDWKFQIDAFKAGFKFAPIPSILAYYRFKQKPRDEKRVLELKNLALSDAVPQV